MDDNVRKREPRWHRAGVLAVRVVALLVVAAGLFIAIVVYPSYRICDQELSTTGKVVNVCRHLQATDPPVIAVGLVVLAALGVFFPEISALGLSLKRGVAEAKDTASQAAAIARSAGTAAQVAEAVLLDSGRDGTEARVISERQPGVAQEIRSLAEEYNATRRAISPGVERTSKMTSIVARMISALNNVRQEDFDLSGSLGSEDPGLRLAGYADLYANPDPLRTQEIASALLDEDKPFTQYWGLRALRRQVESDPAALDLNTRRRLSELLKRVGSGTDRAYELRQILGDP